MKALRSITIFAVLIGILFALPMSTFGQEAGLDTILTEGKAAFEDHLYKLAEEHFLRYLEEGGDTLSQEKAENAAVYLMRSLHEQKKHQVVLSLLKGKKPWVAKAGDGNAIKYWRAMALYELKRHDETLSDLNKIVENPEDNEYDAKAEHLKAWCYLKTGKTEQALTAFKAFARKSNDPPSLPDYMLEWAKAICNVHREEGLHILQELSKMPQTLKAVQEGQYLLGQLLIKENQLKDAAAILAPLSTNNTAHADLRANAWFSLASIQEAATNRNEAIICLTNGIFLAKSPELKAKGNYDLGWLLLDMGRLDEGVPLLKSFVSSSPDDALAGPTQLKIADTLLNNGENESAISEFQLYLETFTNNIGKAQAHNGKGWGLLSMERFSEAAIEFTKAYDLFEDQSRREESLFKVGDAYFSNSQFQLALDTYKRFTTEFPKSETLSRALFQLAESTLQAGKASEAENAFLELSKQFSDDPVAEESLMRVAEIQVRVAEAHDKQGRWIDGTKGFNKAIGVFTEVMNVYSNGNMLAQALHGRGRALYHQRQLERALADFTRVTDAFPRSTVFEHSTYMLGLCHYMMAQDKEALSVWSSFVELHPESSWAPIILFEIAKYHLNSGDCENAEKQFLIFVEEYPTDPLAADALLRAAKAAFKQKAYGRVVELVNRLAKEYSESKALPDARFQQAEALHQGMAEYAAAILIYDEIMNKYPDNDLVIHAQLRKGVCQFWLGSETPQRYNEAIESYRAVANNSDASPDLAIEALYRVGLCFEKLEKPEEALRQYHSKVMVRFLDEREKGVQHNESAKVWFWRASWTAAQMLIKKEEWRKAVRILERAVEAGVPAADEAQEEIKRIKSKYFWMFF